MTRRFPLALMRSAALLALAMPAAAIIAPGTAMAEVSFGLSIRIGYPPPPMPVYEQPPLPGPDYIWVPGHWEWSDWIDDYFWVDGYWDQPPEPGLLWTPAWWGWDHGAYVYHGGYWGREVGWYGGIDFGFGYHGHGWEGGYWNGRHLAYNRAAVNVTNVTNINVTNVYYRPVRTEHNDRGPRVSYAGGQGGVRAEPTPAELRASQAPHIPPTPVQQQRIQQAAATPTNHAARLAPAWHPPAVHRVADDGTPIPRTVALTRGGATAGAPPAYQRPAATPGQPAPGTPQGNFGARNPGALPAATPGTMPGNRPAMAPGGYPQAGQPTAPQGQYGAPPRSYPQVQNGQGQYPGQGTPPPRPGYGGAPVGQPGQGQYGRGPNGQYPGSPGGYQPPRPTPPPPPQGYTPPRPQPMGQPGYGQAPHPAPQVMPQAVPHMAPPAPPPPRAAPPPPRPAPPPQQHPREHDHS